LKNILLLVFLLLLVFVFGCIQQPSGEAKGLIQKNSVKLEADNGEACVNCIKNSGLAELCSASTDKNSKACVQLISQCSAFCGLSQAGTVTTEGWWTDAIECLATDGWMRCMRRRGWYDGQ
jgi:hypothetical protein